MLNVYCTDWCCSWNSNTLATWCEELTHLTKPWCWERLKARGEGNNRGWDGWMSLSKLQELVLDREARHAAVHGITKSWTGLSNWTELCMWQALLSFWIVLPQSWIIVSCVYHSLFCWIFLDIFLKYLCFFFLFVAYLCLFSWTMNSILGIYWGCFSCSTVW